MDETSLDNPVWWAAVGDDRPHTLGGELARRFPAEMSPFAAVVDERDPAAWAELAALAAGEPVGVISTDLPDGWSQLLEIPVVQMVFDADSAVPPRSSETFAPLTRADSAAMVALAELTEPGPFGPATVDFGGYRGLWSDGELVCMAGERMHPGDWTEISAVCTDPRFRGRGLAGAIVASLVVDILAAGRRPYLNVAIDNVGAARVYERLGFRERTRMVIRGIQRPLG